MKKNLISRLKTNWLFAAISICFFAVCTAAAHLQFAVVQNTITGRSRGKVGGLVFSTMFGRNVLKSKPLTVHNPKSLKQRTQRASFVLILEFLRPILSIIKTGFREMAIGMSAFNAAMSFNILNAISGDYPNFVIDYPNLLVASGSLEPSDTPSATAIAGHKVTLAWLNNDTDGNASATDIMAYAIIDTDSGKVFHDITAKKRSDLTVDITVTAATVGHDVEVYMFWVSTVTKKVSTSEYLGTKTIINA